MSPTVAVGFQLIKDEAFQVGVDIAPARHPHVRHKARGYLKLYRSGAANEAELLHHGKAVAVCDLCLRTD